MPNKRKGKSDKTSIKHSKKFLEDVYIKQRIVKVGNTFRLLRTFVTKSGNVITKSISPLMFKFERKDVAQVFIGSLLLSTSFMFTQEVWELGAELSIFSTFSLVFLSLLSLVILNYYTRYQNLRNLDGKISKIEFMKRIFGTYIITLFIVGILMTIIGKAPWSTDFPVAFKRTILVSLPACLGGSVADLVK